MTLTKEEIEKMDPEEVFEWDVEKLDAALKELNVKVGSSWSKSKKAHELTRAISDVTNNEAEVSKSSDPNAMMFQAFQIMQIEMADQKQVLATQMQAQMIQAEKRQNQAMQAIAEKIGGTQDGNNSGAGRGGNKSRSKGRHPKKLDIYVNYATFLQCEKS